MYKIFESMGYFNTLINFVRAFFSTSVWICLSACGFGSFLWEGGFAEIMVGAVAWYVERSWCRAQQLIFNNKVDLTLETVHVILVQGLEPRLPVVVEGTHRLATKLRLRVQTLRRFGDSLLLR